MPAKRVRFKPALKANKHKFLESGFVKQLQEEAAKGHIRPIDPFQFEFMLNSMISAPFLVMPALKDVKKLEEKSWNIFWRSTKKIVSDLIIAYLEIHISE